MPLSTWRRPLSLLTSDLDGFKPINDALGHAAGDTVLRAVGRALLVRTRKGDVVCRYGGDEFLVILPDMSLPDALRRAEDLRTHVAGVEVSHAGRRLTISLSCGLAVFPDHAVVSHDLLHRADDALYAAKNGGGNRFIAWHSGLGHEQQT